MKFKTNNTVKTRTKSNISLPIIADCSVGFRINKQLFVDETLYENSIFYQTSKMICYAFYKPLHIKKNNDK